MNDTSPTPTGQPAGPPSVRPDKPPSAHIADEAAAQIPDELKRLPHWVVWGWVWNPNKKQGGAWDKPPINPRTGKPTDATDETAWMSFDEARAEARRLGDGIGFALGKVDRRDATLLHTAPRSYGFAAMVTATREERDMPRSSPLVEEQTRPENSPIAWFSELLIATDRGDYPRAAESQRQLARLGWNVTRRKAPRSERGTA